MSRVWDSVQVCQVVCECITSMYSGDAGSYDETTTIRPSTTFQDISNDLHGYTCTGIPF